MRAGRHQRDRAAALAHHGARLRRRACAVIDRGVGHVHAGEAANHGLIFKDGLEQALADLSLIGRVGGQKGLLGRDGAHDSRDVVVIGPRAAQNGAEHAVLLREPLHMAANLQFRKAAGEHGRLLEEHALRHIGIKRLHRRQADAFQHRAALLRRDRYIAAHGISPPSAWPRIPRRTGSRRYRSHSPRG